MVSLFWVAASGLVFLAAGYFFTVTLLHPSNTMRHLWAVTISYLLFMITGFVFVGFILSKFMTN